MLANQASVLALVPRATATTGDGRHIPAKPGVVAFGVAAREWVRYIEYDRERRPSTVMDYRWVVEHHLIPEFAEQTSLTLIDADRVDEYRERLVREGRLSARTINKLLVNLNGVFRRARRAYGLLENPVQLVERQPVCASGDFHVLTPAQIRQLLNVAANHQDAAILAVAAYSGLRLGELRALSWGDLDINRRVIRVRQNYTRGHFERPKSGRIRSVPLTDEVLGALAPLRCRGHHLAADDLVFLGCDGAPVEEERLWKTRS